VKFTQNRSVIYTAVRRQTHVV